MPYRVSPSLTLICALVATTLWLGCGDDDEGKTWPNEPAGFVVLTDYDFSDSIPGGRNMPVGIDGWSINNDDGLAARVSDSSAPLSGSLVGEWTYPSGFRDGEAPATMFRSVGGVSEIYIGFWWKASNPWQYEDGGPNKIMFQFTAGGGQMYLAMWGNGLLRATTEFSTGPNTNYDPNKNATPITLGVWHCIELYMHKSTHTMKWWMDGQLQGSYTNISYPSQNFNEFQLSPTWGGNIGDIKTQTDYFWYDHVHISRR